MVSMSQKEFNNVFKPSNIKETAPTKLTKLTPLKTRKKSQDLEHLEQVKLIRWVNLQADEKVKMIYAIPNGGHRSKSQGAKLKAEGVTAGIPDLHLPIPSKGYGSLYIEMKYGSNKLSKIQKDKIEMLRNYGNLCMVCYSFEEAKKTILEYLGL
jgi:hypothetical protein